MKLSDLIQQEQFRSTGHEAMLNVLATSSWIFNALTTTMAPYGITPAQYNVLRILRGSHPKTLTCSTLGHRLLDRTPDVTRLLNRLQGHGFIQRARAEHDRRIVEVGITDAGLDLLSRMDDDIEAVEHRLMHDLSATEHQHLSQLLERIRVDQRP